MTRSELSNLLHKSINDEQFRANLESDPATTVSQFDLSKKEKEAIIKGDEELIRNLMAEDQPARRPRAIYQALSSEPAPPAGD